MGAGLILIHILDFVTNSLKVSTLLVVLCQISSLQLYYFIFCDNEVTTSRNMSFRLVMYVISFRRVSLIYLHVHSVRVHSTHSVCNLKNNLKLFFTFVF